MIDFAKLARDRGIPMAETGHRHCHTGWVQFHCPFCSSGTHGFHLGWNIATGVFHCWRCGQVSRAKIFEALLGANARQILKAYQVMGIASRRIAPVEIIAPSTLELPLDYGSLLDVHKRYLESRGFEPEHIKRLWEVGGVGRGGGQWSWRLLIPFMDCKGAWVSYQGRSIASDAKGVKYLTLANELSIIPPKCLLYGEHLVPADTVVVVEGVMDAWRLGPGAVALLGVGYTDVQAGKLLAYKNRFILFDPDGPGQRAAKELAAWLSPHGGNTEILSGFDSDPGDMSSGEVADIRSELGL